MINFWHFAVFLVFQLMFSVVGANGSGEIDIDFKKPPDTKHRISEHLSYGVDLVVELELIDDYDLDIDEDDHLSSISSEVNMALSYFSPGRLVAYSELQLEGHYLFSQGPDNEEEADQHFRIEQLYLQEPLVTGKLGYTFGRQRFKDTRSWWYDENLDALQISWKKQEFFFNGSVARERYFADDFLDEDTEKEIDYLIFTAGRYLGKRDQTTYLLLTKRDRRPGKHDEPIYVGYQRIGQIGSDVRYWVNAAYLDGEYKQRDLRSMGFDGGITWRATTLLNPFVTLGFAYASGDDDLSDGEDGNFRQTDLQDNEGKSFGITSYNYYGEIMDLDLSNMRIATLGLGFRPASQTSIELSYHHYTQIEPDNDLSDTDLERDPNGDSPELGEELDIIFAHRADKDFDISFIFGHFRPGEAYDRGDPSNLLRVKFSVEF